MVEIQTKLKFTQVRKLMARRLEPGWNFSTLYLIKDSLAIMLEAAGLLEDAFREYFELEACYLEALKQGGNLAGRQFGEPLHFFPACLQTVVLFVCASQESLCDKPISQKGPVKMQTASQNS